MGSLLPCALQGGGAHASVRPLVIEPGQTFLPAEDGQDVEYARGGGAPGERGTQRLSDGAELEAVLVGKGPHHGFRLCGGAAHVRPWRLAKPVLRTSWSAEARISVSVASSVQSWNALRATRSRQINKRFSGVSKAAAL